MAIGYLDDKYLKSWANRVRDAQGSSLKLKVDDIWDDLLRLKLTVKKCTVKLYSRNLADAPINYTCAVGTWPSQITDSLKLKVVPSDVGSADPTLINIAQGIQFRITPADGYKFSKYNNGSYTVSTGCDIDLSTSSVLWFTPTSSSVIIEMFIEKST